MTAEAKANPDDTALGAALAREDLLMKAEQIRALAGFGLTDTEITLVLGIKPDDLYANRGVIGDWMVEGRAKAKGQVRQSLYRQAVLGSAQHISLYEQLVFGWKPTQRNEQTGKDGDPQEVNVREVMGDEELMGRIRALRDRALATMDRSVGATALPAGKEVKPG